MRDHKMTMTMSHWEGLGKPWAMASWGGVSPANMGVPAPSLSQAMVSKVILPRSNVEHLFPQPGFWLKAII